MIRDPSHPDSEPTPFWRSRYAIGLLAMGAIATYFLLSEHRAHFLGALPLLRYPNLDLMSHDTGHLWSTLLGEKGDPHFSPLHIASYVFLGFGFYLLSTAWNVLYHAQRRNALATAGPYARIRRPQYVAFVLILLGFLLQWPVCQSFLWGAWRSVTTSSSEIGMPITLACMRILDPTVRPPSASTSIDGRRRVKYLGAAPRRVTHADWKARRSI